LALDAEAPLPPADLAARTVARLAETAVQEGWFDARSARIQLPDDPVPTPATPSTLRRPVSSDEAVFVGRRRADVIVAVCIGLLLAGIGVTAVQKLRAGADVAACQNQMRSLHAGLTGYADVRQGQYPIIGTPSLPTAGSFAEELARSGQMPVNFIPVCPADVDASIRTVGFTYTLGFRSQHGVIGVRRPDPLRQDADGNPVLADFATAESAPAGGPFSPHVRGQNVLFAGGHVRFVTIATVGLNGDDIYRNAAGQIGAGLSPVDSCLGRPGDRP
jgi:prepilin-type processing-associated H-X9-DG protein